MSETSGSWGPATRPQPGSAPKTLADTAYRRLRNDIIQGALLPRARLQPDELRRRYDIGLSPIREALSRLASDGLVVAEGQRGFFVAPVSKGELLDIIDLRIQFSVVALERSIRLGDETWESRVVTAYYRLNKAEKRLAQNPLAALDEWEGRNREFHLQLESACGSPWLLHFCERLYDQIERYRRLFFASIERPQIANDEHRILMEAALARRSDDACRVLGNHFARARDAVIALIEAADAERAGAGVKPPARAPVRRKKSPPPARTAPPAVFPLAALLKG